MFGYNNHRYRSSVRKVAGQTINFKRHRDLSPPSRYGQSRRTPQQERNMYANLQPSEQFVVPHDQLLASYGAVAPATSPTRNSEAIATPVSPKSAGPEISCASTKPLPPHSKRIRVSYHRVSKRQIGLKGRVQAKSNQSFFKGMVAQLQEAMSAQAATQAAAQARLQADIEELKVLLKVQSQAQSNSMEARSATDLLVEKQVNAESKEAERLLNEAWKFACEPGPLSDADRQELFNPVSRKKSPSMFSRAVPENFTRDILLSHYDFSISELYIDSSGGNGHQNYQKLGKLEFVWIGLQVDQEKTQNEIISEIKRLYHKLAANHPSLAYRPNEPNVRASDPEASIWSQLVEECRNISALPELVRASLNRWETYPESIVARRLWNQEKRCCYHCLETLIRVTATDKRAKIAPKKKRG